MRCWKEVEGRDGMGRAGKGRDDAVCEAEIKVIRNGGINWSASD